MTNLNVAMGKIDNLTCISSNHSSLDTNNLKAQTLDVQGNSGGISVNYGQTTVGNLSFAPQNFEPTLNIPLTEALLKGFDINITIGVPMSKIDDKEYLMEKLINSQHTDEKEKIQRRIEQITLQEKKDEV